MDVATKDDSNCRDNVVNMYAPAGFPDSRIGISVNYCHQGVSDARIRGHTKFGTLHLSA